MKFLKTAILLFIASYTFAQKQNVYFLKNNGGYVNSKDSADYIRVVREPDSASALYNVFEFYKNGRKKLIGKSLTINPQKFEGQCLVFYPNGAKASISNYKNGLKSGSEYIFYPNGKIYLTKQYPENGSLNNQFGEVYLIQSSYDSLGVAQVVDGKGYFKGFDEHFTYIDEEGNVKDGKRDGSWKGEFKNTKTSFTEKYNNGDLISGTATDSLGKVNTYTKSRYIIPQFTGGVVAFGKYLSDNIIYPGYARQRNIQGTVIVSFIVERDGTVNNVKVVRAVNEVLDVEAVRVIKKSPKWVPGTILGKPVRVAYSVPVRFALSGN